MKEKENKQGLFQVVPKKNYYPWIPQPLPGIMLSPLESPETKRNISATDAPISASGSELSDQISYEKSHPEVGEEFPLLHQ